MKYDFELSGGSFLEPFIWEQATSLLRISVWEENVPGLKAGFTTRLGGVSAGPFDSMNCGLHVGDEDKDVVTNRQNLAAKLNFSFNQWTCAEQIHSNRIMIIGDTERGKGNRSRDDAIQDVDGLVTSLPDVLLTSFYADCVPLFFLAPSKPVIGIAHAGWKGTASNIGAKMVECFKNDFGINPVEIKVAIGPSIGGCCYEVDDKVIKKISLNLTETNSSFYKIKGNGKYQVDLKKANQILIEHAGVPASHILSSNWCTSCRNDLFFSHRKEAGKTGRMAAFIGLNREV